MPALASIPAWIAAALALLVPFALWFDGQVHTSQAQWFGLALAGGMFALVVPNRGAAALLALSSAMLLIGRHLAVTRAVPLEVYRAASETHAYLVAGVAVLALAPIVFAGRPALLANTCRLLVLLLAAWWLAGLLGVDPLLRPSDHGAGLAMGHNGGPLGSPIVLAGLLGAAWPLFLPMPWAWAVVPLLICLGAQTSATGWLAAGASAGAVAWTFADSPRAKWWVAGVCMIVAAGAFCFTVLTHRGPGATHRLMIWAQVVQDSRLFGWGPGSWGLTLGRTTGHASPYSAYALVLWEYGWAGLACVVWAAVHAIRRAKADPILLASLVGLLVASGGTLLWENPVTAAWGLMLLGLIEVNRASTP